MVNDDINNGMGWYEMPLSMTMMKLKFLSFFFFLNKGKKS